MVGEPLHLMTDLRLNVLEELRGGWVHRAAEHTVLPDEQPLLITEVVEDLLLIHAAAPDAQHVHVRIDGGLEELLVAIIGEPGGEGIEGDPVGSLGEDVDSVYREGHRATALRILDGLHFEGPEADASGCRLLPDGHRERIEDRLAVTGRPPALDTGDRQAEGEEILPALDADLPLLDGGGDLQPHAEALVSYCVVAYRCCHRPSIVFGGACLDVDAFDEAFVDKVECDGLVDPHGKDARAPIPPEVALGLADEVAVFRVDRIDRVWDGVGQLLSLCLCIRFGAGEVEGDGVLPDSEMVSEVEAPTAELVVCHSYNGIIDADGDDGIGHGEGEDGARVVQVLLRDGKASTEDPIELADPLHVQLIGSPIGIGDDVCLQKSAVDVAGQGAWERWILIEV